MSTPVMTSIPKFSNSDLQTFSLISKALIELSPSPHNHLSVVCDMAKLFNITPERARESYFYFINNNSQNTQMNKRMQSALKFVNPSIDAFDKILLDDFKYSYPKTQVTSVTDMKNYDRVNVDHIIEKTKQKKGIAEFISLLREQRDSISRKRLVGILEILKKQL